MPDTSASDPFSRLGPAVWHEALDAMDAAVVLYDRDDRLLLCNQGFRDLYPQLADILQPGVAFETLLRTAVERDLLPQARGQTEAFVQERLAQHADPGAPVMRQFGAGTWRRITQQRLADGSQLAFSIDVTELVDTQLALQAARDEARRAAQRLEDAVEAIPAGIEVFDAEDRLVLANTRLREMYPRIATQLVPGATFESLVRANVAAGGLPGVAVDDDWLAARQATRRAPGPPLEQQLVDGRWIRTYERRTREGLVGIRVDITELVTQRKAAEAASDQLRDAVDALPEGFALYDAEDRLVICNQHYRDMYPLSAAAMQPGARFEAIVRYGLARGQYPASEGRHDEWLEERMYRHRHPEQPILQELPDNRWLRIDERRSRSGGIAGVRTDVTEFVRRGQQLEQANASLLESRAQLRAIIGNALSAVLTLGEDGRILSANPATLSIFGWEPDQLVGQAFSVLLPAFDQERLRRDLLARPGVPAARPEAQGGLRLETAGRHVDGRTLTVQLALSELKVAGPLRCVAIITDLSERETAAQALRDANMQLERLSQTDPLTGIANRRRFDAELHAEWQRASRAGLSIALLIVASITSSATTTAPATRPATPACGASPNCCRRWRDAPATSWHATAARSSRCCCRTPPPATRRCWRSAASTPSNQPPCRTPTRRSRPTSP